MIHFYLFRHSRSINIFLRYIIKFVIETGIIHGYNKIIQKVKQFQKSINANKISSRGEITFLKFAKPELLIDVKNAIS